jgi:hypothetical protein
VADTIQIKTYQPNLPVHIAISCTPDVIFTLAKFNLLDVTASIATNTQKLKVQHH